MHASELDDQPPRSGTAATPAPGPLAGRLIAVTRAEQQLGEARQQLGEAQQELALYARAFEASGEAMLVTTADGRIVALNPAMQALAGQRTTAWALLHAATRGAARALRLDHELGSLEPGRVADVCLWRWAVGTVPAHRDHLARSLHERIFAWLTLGDERNLAEAWVAGACRHRAPDWVQSHPSQP